MSLTEEELTEHCRKIIYSPRINNRIVILCEGGIENFKDRPSPQSYAKMEQIEDARFYKKCIPFWWRQNQPNFFVCGDRNDVLNTFFKLPELHQKDTVNSYLNPQLLFAWVDLDIQPKILPKYGPCNSLEEIFNDIYLHGRIQEYNLSQHQIWVTGLIHKEAYFLLPFIQPVFTHSSAVFQNQPVDLENIYQLMGQQCGNDKDLTDYFASVCTRIQDYVSLNYQDVHTFQQSWLQQFQNTSDTKEKEKLAEALLTLRKAKPYWKNIQPPHALDDVEIERFKDQLVFDIARLYSQEDMSSHHHLPTFFKVLHQTIYG